MSLKETKRLKADVLIIGGGGASLRAAIEAREMGADVLVVSKARIGYANNTYISAGIFAATGWGDPDDDYRVHLKDAVIGGRFVNDQKLLAVAVREAGAQVTLLERCGVKFFKQEGKLRLGRAPGHSHSRHVNVFRQGGSGFMLPLKAQAEKVGVRFKDQAFITRLVKQDQQIAGALGFDSDGSFLVFRAKCIILTTGGYSRIYQRTNNAAGITGDGLALAFDLGLPLRDMEFVQFYPTSLGSSGNRNILYEGIVALGNAVLRNAEGENIITKHQIDDPRIMTRDRVSRAIMEEIREGRGVDGGVILDLSTVADLPRWARVFPKTWSAEETEMKVSPTTHFCMGGVITDEQTETAVSGLFAAGEVTGGVHGANRLGGNALAEVFALGGVAGRQAALRARQIDMPDIHDDPISVERARLAALLSSDGSEDAHDQQEIRRLLKDVMWRKAGVLRTDEELGEALDEIERLNTDSRRLSVSNARQLMKLQELLNMLLISEMVCLAARRRTESRGAHFRSDFPKEDNTNWLKNTVIQKTDGAIGLTDLPVSMDHVKMPET
ncbi:MAG: FAD-binding protein [Desulfobacterales bacterium]